MKLTACNSRSDLKRPLFCASPEMSRISGGEPGLSLGIDAAAAVDAGAQLYLTTESQYGWGIKVHQRAGGGLGAEVKLSTTPKSRPKRVCCSLGPC